MVQWTSRQLRKWYQLVSPAMRLRLRLLPNVWWLIMIPNPNARYRLPITATRVRSSVWHRCPSHPRNRSRGRSTTRSRNRNSCISVRRQGSTRNARAVGRPDRRSRMVDRWLIDVIRKNSTARYVPRTRIGVGVGVRVGAGGVTTPVLPPVTEQQPPLHAMNMSSQVPQGPAQAPPQPQRQSPNQHRYTLIDPGANSAGVSTPPSRTDSPVYPWPAGRPPGQRMGNMPAVLPPDMEGPGASQPSTTFAEMGIQGVKLEEKVCDYVIFVFCRCVA